MIYTEQIHLRINSTLCHIRIDILFLVIIVHLVKLNGNRSQNKNKIAEKMEQRTRLIDSRFFLE